MRVADVERVEDDVERLIGEVVARQVDGNSAMRLAEFGQDVAPGETTLDAKLLRIDSLRTASYGSCRFTLKRPPVVRREHVWRYK